jgi:hypothetical protein
MRYRLNEAMPKMGVVGDSLPDGSQGPEAFIIDLFPRKLRYRSSENPLYSRFLRC